MEVWADQLQEGQTLIQQRELQLDKEEHAIRQRAATTNDREVTLDLRDKELRWPEELVNKVVANGRVAVAQREVADLVSAARLDTAIKVRDSRAADATELQGVRDALAV